MAKLLTPTPGTKVAAMTAAALLCFALNSVLCRLALSVPVPDPTGFTVVRLVSGACLLLLLFPRSLAKTPALSWLTGGLLTAYALFFSLAYTSLSAGTGAILLFGSVQLTMVSVSVATGHRASVLTWLGLLVALGGLIWLVLPGVQSPPPIAAGAMCVSGSSWGAYSLLGKRIGDPRGETARAFAVAALVMGAVFLITGTSHSLTAREAALGVVSGAITSGLGYVLWYSALGRLSTFTASAVQLCVPVLAALLGVLLLGESLTLRNSLCSALILGGVGVVVRQNSGESH